MKAGAYALGIAIMAGLAGWLPSCSGSGSGDASASSGSPIPESDFRQRVIDAACSGLGTCCQSSGHTFNRQACLDALDAEFSDMPTAAEGYRYNAAAGGACVEGVRDTLANCGDMDDVAECELVFTGTLPEGASCDDDDACAAPAGGIAYCSYPSDEDIGTCRPLTRAVQGEACAASGRDGDWYELRESAPGGICFREDGLFCEDFATCQPLRAIGAACVNSDDCVDGAVCDSSSRTCVAIAAVGGPCSNDSQCAEDAYCGPELTCAPLKGPGAACETDFECSNYFCDAGACSASEPWPTAEQCAGNYD